jgi:transposase
MTNVIGYNQLPDRKLFEELYKTHSQAQLSQVFKCNECRIKKWIEIFGLKLRPPGGGNNRKFNPNKESIIHYFNEGLNHNQVAKIFGMSPGCLHSWKKRYGIKKKYNTTEYQKYARKARWLTESNYAKYKEVINPDNLPRTLCGVNGGYQLDHILSVRECFDLQIPIEECADLKNLQLISWEENLQKRIYNKGEILVCL